MKVSITFSELSAENAAKLIDTAKEFAPTTKLEPGEGFAETTGAQGTGSAKGPKKTSKKPAKETAAEEIEETTDGETEEVDLGFGETEASGPTVDDVIAAMKKFADKKDRKAAMKVLAKYKVKSVHDLDADDLPKILKDLKA